MMNTHTSFAPTSSVTATSVSVKPTMAMEPGSGSVEGDVKHAK